MNRMFQGKNQVAFGANHSGPSASTYLDYIQSRRGKRGGSEQRQLFTTADEKMKRIHDIIWQIADTNVPVLITGESGVGKEVISRSIHEAASQKERPYVAVNCAAMPATLLESELFGYEKGAFTGANQRKEGKFEAANNGTILLDEITEMDLALQAKLLRVLQEKEVDRIGGSTAVAINTRVIATTTRDIVAEVAKGTFRQDLYYRLYVLHIEVPPLRERKKDIEVLSHKFIGELAEKFERPNLTLSEDGLKKLLDYDWPGNIRELQNVLQRYVLLSSKDIIGPEIVTLEDQGVVSASEWISALPIGQPLRIVETQFILETLKNHNGNRTHAAKTLGISLRTLRNKINEFTAEGYEVMAPMNNNRATA